MSDLPTEEMIEAGEKALRAAGWLADREVIAKRVYLAMKAVEPGWEDIETAESLDRIMVAGWQRPSGNVAGYWWIHEDCTDENGVPITHSLATKWRPLPPLPEGV
jgi:hypothetical protein